MECADYEDKLVMKRRQLFGWGAHNSSVLLLVSQVRYTMIPGRRRHSARLSVTLCLTLLGLTSHNYGKMSTYYEVFIIHHDENSNNDLKNTLISMFSSSFS